VTNEGRQGPHHNTFVNFTANDNEGGGIRFGPGVGTNFFYGTTFKGNRGPDVSAEGCAPQHFYDTRFLDDEGRPRASGSRRKLVAFDWEPPWHKKESGRANPPGTQPQPEKKRRKRR
jgi:hypothetical protein